MLEFPAIGKLNVEFFAQPRDNVKPGDVLTLTLILENASRKPMRGLVLAVPVPLGAAAFEGWLYRDAVRAEEGAFFGEGTELAELAPGARTAIMWKLRVEESEEPLRLVPQIWGAVTPLAGANAIEISRAPLRRRG